MNPRAIFFARNFLAPLGGPTGAQFRVTSMAWDAMGGPSEAEIEVTGSDNVLWDMFNLLRSPVEIHDPFGWCWWGMANEVVLEKAGLTRGLDNMQNRVAVAYSYIGPGTNTVGVRKTTPWIQDDHSVLVFGTKEFLSSQSGMTDAAALTQRNAILERFKRPPGAPDLSALKEGAASSATIRCKGWWDSMKWRYASVPSTESVSYPTQGSAEQVIGSANSNIRVMQQFTVGGAAINMIQIAIVARKVGNPTDNLTLSVMAVDGSGNPTGSSLASSSIAAALLTTSHARTQVTVNEKQLDANTMYALQIGRSGQVDANNYFAVNVNESLGYSGGVFRIYNSSWGTRTPNADMPFWIMANPQVETTTQIANLVTNFGQFLTGTVILNASGITQGAFRNGDKTARMEAESLLKAATTNGRRLFVWVTRERKVIISEEPAQTSNPHYQIDGKRRLYEDGGRYMRLIPPVGKWVRMLGRPNSGSMVSNDQQLISGGTWSPDNGLQISIFGQPSPSEILGVER